MSASTAAANRTRLASRISIRNILFASDLSPESERAFDHVRLLAERFRAELTLYHAIEMLDHRYPDWPAMDDVWTEAVQSTRLQLGRLAEPLTTAHTVTVERALSARQAVVDMIRGRRPDLTVMASHPHTGLGHLLGASVTEDVVEHVHSPVLGVRRTRRLPYRRILVPTDFSLASRLAFPIAALMASTFEAELLALHVTPPLTAATLAGIAPARAVPSEAALWDFVRPDFEPLPVTAQVQTGTAWDRIVHTAELEDADLIVMATRGHDSLSDRILGSNTERVLRHAPCPVLVA